MITLDRLVNVLGGYGVVARLGRVARGTVLRSVVVPEPGVGGDVLLAIGASSVEEAVAWAATAGAPVVVVRAPDTSASDVGDVAVLVINATSWSELAAVVYGLVLEGRETESGRGPTDLFALADSLADAIGGAVVIESARSDVLAYSRGQSGTDPARAQTILGRRAPDAVHEFLYRSGVFAHLAVSDEALFVAGETELGLTGRMVVAVRIGRELFGSVWVTCDRELRGASRTALTEGARTVALHLLRSRASADLERQVESEAVIRLLDGAADAATVASRLGLAPGPLRVIAVRARLAAEPHTAPLVTFEHATAGFGWSRPGRSALSGSTVYTVLPGSEVATARRWLTALHTSLPPGTDVVAGISGPAATGELAAARAEADECLALHENAGGDPPAFDQAWDDVLLQRLRTAAESGRGPSRGPVADLVRHDREHGTPYVATLRAWLAAQGDPVQAGAALGVHENTVRYRLRKMADVASIEVDDARKRLAMMIELQVIDPQ